MRRLGQGSRGAALLRRTRLDVHRLRLCAPVPAPPLLPRALAPRPSLPSGIGIPFNLLLMAPPTAVMGGSSMRLDPYGPP